MAAPDRRTDPPLDRTLYEEPYRFDFFQAVRLLGLLRPDRARVGRDADPGQEAVRFLAHLSLSFPASSIHHLDPLAGPAAAADAPPEMTVAFLGLTGPMGVLPHAYTELLMERTRAGDRTAAAFLDLFHHRLISLFFRAWERVRPPLGFERGDDDRFSAYLFDLIGLGAGPLRDRHDFPDASLLYYAGLFAQRHRPAVALEALLNEAFGLPVEVRQFVGRWLRMEADDLSTLGASGRHNQLGTSFVLGARTWDEPGQFRLRVGPLTFPQFLALLPDGLTFRPLSQMARLFVDAELDFDLQLILRAADVPPCRLTSAPGAGARLGRYAWLTSRAVPNDADDAVFPSGV